MKDSQIKIAFLALFVFAFLGCAKVIVVDPFYESKWQSEDGQNMLELTKKTVIFNGQELRFDDEIFYADVLIFGGQFWKEDKKGKKEFLFDYAIKNDARPNITREEAIDTLYLKEENTIEWFDPSPPKGIELIIQK